MKRKRSHNPPESKHKANIVDSRHSSPHKNRKEVCDLFVPLPKDTNSDIPILISVEPLLSRFKATGFTTIAFTHTVYGRANPEDDADKVFPPSNLETVTKASNLKVLRRLHAIVESMADVGYYNSWIGNYDIISICPRNEASFQAACSSGTASSILTLDYTAGRGKGQLPFLIRPNDVKALIARGACFEVPYAPAILNRTSRRGLVHTSRSLQQASLGLKPSIIFSSGYRVEDGKDLGALALRTPEDLVNLFTTVMRFDSPIASRTLTSSCTDALDHANRMRYGNSQIARVFSEKIAATNDDQGPKEEQHLTNGKEAVVDEPNDDGYIAF